jgi:hypothetical protein
MPCPLASGARGSRERYPRAISQQALARSQVAIGRLWLPACSAWPAASRSQTRRLPDGYRSAQACDVTTVTRALVWLSTLAAALTRGGIMNCPHQPPCPPADAPDCEAAHVVAAHPEQGWSLLCNGVVVFEDTGDLLPDGRIVAPHRPAT